MGRLEHGLGLVFVLAFSAVVVHAQPFIFYRGIVNAASYAPQGLPSGSIARGSIFSIFGRNLGPAQGTTVSSFPLGTNFQGVSIEVCQNANCVAALPLFVGAGQINAIMPSNAPLGAVSVRVTFNGQASNFSPVTVVASSPGIFAINSGGFGPGVVQNFTPEALPVNSAVVTARPGQTMIAWGTGLGAGLNADNVAPQSGDLPVNAEIWAGGKLVTVKRYSGRSPCCAGVDQIIFDLPPDTPTGCYVPIQIRTGGQMVSNSISIAVSADGGPCSDPFNSLSQMFRTGGKLGLILANRINTLLRFTEPEREETIEFALATFRQENGGPFAYNALASLPPPGSCTVHAVPGDFLGGAVIPAFRASGPELNAGQSLTFGNLTIRKSAPDSIYYGGTLAGTPPGFLRRGLVASVLGTPLSVSGAGGADVGSFALQFPPVPGIRWFSRDQGNAVDRSGGFVMEWEGGDAPGSVVLVAGINSNVPANASGVFLCTAVPGTKSFGVPPHVVQALPPSPEVSFLNLAFGYVMVGVLSLNGSPVISAPGLDAGNAVITSWSAREVRYQ
jgi:uncharacterized protein (TIGR03437 family)